jgi:TonB family protein
MLSLAASAQVLLRVFLSILLSQSRPQSVAPGSETTRIHLKENDLACFTTNAVKPVYPREARLSHIEGTAKLNLVIAADGSTADLQAVSGDPLLLDSTMQAVRQWRFSVGGLVGKPRETEVSLSFTFKIEDPPQPAYLHLTNGHVIRADEVREFTDRIEYSVDRRTYQISPDSVSDINACARISIRIPPRDGDCIPSGGPTFFIHAIPLLPAEKTTHSARSPLH